MSAEHLLLRLLLGWTGSWLRWLPLHCPALHVGLSRTPSIRVEPGQCEGRTLRNFPCQGREMERQVSVMCLPPCLCKHVNFVSVL
jgi:hypothetical protein